MKYNKHIFICINERAECGTKGDCAQKGGKEIRMRFVQLINEHGLKGKVRANKSGCLDACEMGAAIVIYPRGIWYSEVQLEDVDEIFNVSVLGEGIVDRIVSTQETWEELNRIRNKNRVEV
ncbi:MAG: (2Fe-2S) ferredoxin domain-containing protein [Candidatus Marinimicrobia bacterium]|jgi:(2Fe-2S) ferredoxin|nr:(2Fe-2S) ferredoxin domain-containing protein [Candidatus Neomarinimicrobiota bacterium]MBT3676423.1 (2Fe-2S) ferredoxin domain-containing protein [Candidatus Neomarinimicrobiota bacterium]MBT3763769.1 (2Fe-2S) ferredoxin domain-containing protein [Candidatus Neomarinimicrobiota bacterium]MBT4067110.1 (2Fe-2S) ferredoxin domain-containing protein [Candidatus Neomarinimicrobiota bacterium]MBT4270048.1 (2Fe-2S) ferredoxin domain-containing protein [Candidatus Neomarinimicrobiota bacterium]